MDQAHIGTLPRSPSDGAPKARSTIASDALHLKRRCRTGPDARMRTERMSLWTDYVVMKKNESYMEHDVGWNAVHLREPARWLYFYRSISGGSEICTTKQCEQRE